METHNLCVNSVLLDKHINLQDKQDQAFQYVYDKIIYLFRDDLETVEFQEDIYDDMVFETGYLIDTECCDVDKYEIVKQIFKDFNVKEAS